MNHRATCETIDAGLQNPFEKSIKLLHFVSCSCITAINYPSAAQDKNAIKQICRFIYLFKITDIFIHQVCETCSQQTAKKFLKFLSNSSVKYSIKIMYKTYVNDI